MGICDSVSNKRQREQYSMNKTNTFSSIQNTNIMQPSSSQNQPGFYSSRAYQKQPSVKPALTRTATVFQKGEKFYKRKVEKNSDQMKKENDENNNNLKETIELFVSLTEGTNPSAFYMIKLAICNNKMSNKFESLGQTDSLSGTEIIYGESFIIDYYFEKEQTLKCQLFMNGNVLVSQFTTTIGLIMGSRKKNVLTEVKTNYGEKIGNILIEAKSRQNQAGQMISHFQFNLILLSNYQNGANVFYLLSHFNDGKNWRPVYKSEEFDIQPNMQIALNQLQIETDSLIVNNPNQNIKIELYDAISQQIIGTGLFQISQLINQSMINLPTTIEVYSPLNNAKVASFVVFYHQNQKLTFKDYLMKGMEINLEIAIDFTCSNESPDNPISLHYAYGHTPTNYEVAIKSCGSIVGYYDYDQLFPVYGFGGRPPLSNKVSHCFNLTFTDDPNVQGLPEVLKTYRNSLFQIKFDGPTYFAPVITQVMNEIKREMDNGINNHYYILMILTDGIINDMDATCDVIYDAAFLPMSIIIIGIGNANFTNMETLDGDDELLRNSKDEVTKRDLVQFVQFNKYANRVENEGVINELAEDVLKEIPRQVEEYYEMEKNIKFSLLSN